MRRKDIIVLILVCGIAAILSIIVASTSKKTENGITVEDLVHEELTTSMENQKTFFNHMLNAKFSALESLSYYLGIEEEIDFPAEREYCDAVMLANHFAAICLSDLNGNTVAYDGSMVGNIADQQLFREVGVRKDARGIQCSDDLGRGGEPAILIAVPVHHRNVLTGILYAEIDLSYIEEMLLSDDYHGSEAVFVTDSAGNVILRNRNAYGTVMGSNLFENDLADDGTASSLNRHILLDMSSGVGGYSAYSRGEKEYIGYLPIGVNDWYLFSRVSEKTLSHKYEIQSTFVRKVIRSLTGEFFFLAICAAAVIIYFIHRYSWTGRKLQRKNLILEANDAFMFSDSPKPIRELRSAGLAEQIAEHAYGSGSIITSLLDNGKVKVYFVSMGILDALGYAEEEFSDLCEKDVTRIIHPDDMEAVAEANLKNTHVGESFQITVRYRKKSGEYLWIHEYSHIFQLSDGTAVCASQFVDITRQKELEQQLRAREEEYQIAASMSRYVIMRYEVKSRALSILAKGTCAQQFDGVLYDVPEQAIRTGFVAPESIETVRNVFAEIDRGTSRKGKTVLALDPEPGSRLWAEMSYSAVYGSDPDHPAAAILSFIDVTEKRRAEEFMNIGSAFMDYATNAKIVIANLSTGLIEFEAPGTIHRCFTEITGTNRIEKIIQYAIQHAVVPEYVSTFSEYLSIDRLKDEFDRGNTEEGLDCMIVGMNGAEKWVNFQLRLTRESFSGHIKAYLVLKDIDMQKNLEQALQLEKSERKSAESEGTEDSAAENRQIFARTFGYFDLFVDGKPLHFSNQKEKELLAILIDRNGGTLTAEEAISILWEDEPSGEKQLSRYRKLASRLKETLEKAGCGDVVITSHGIRHIDVSKIECDYYEVLGGNSKFIKLYQGIYMLNYSWAEETTASLNRMLLFSEED